MDRIIRMYLDRDVDPNKLLLGIPAYSYGWENVKSNANKDASFSLGKPINIDKVDLSYKTIKKNI